MLKIKIEEGILFDVAPLTAIRNLKRNCKLIKQNYSIGIVVEDLSLGEIIHTIKKIVTFWEDFLHQYYKY